MNTKKTFTDADVQLNLGFKSKNIVFTDVGFHLKSGFKNLLCSRMLVFTKILCTPIFPLHTMANFKKMIFNNIFKKI